jgi:hypothetical protein
MVSDCNSMNSQNNDDGDPIGWRCAQSHR